MTRYEVAERAIKFKKPPRIPYNLALIDHFFPKTPGDFFLAVFLHGGTLLATIIYFWPDISQIATGLRLRWRRYCPGFPAAAAPFPRGLFPVTAFL